MSKSTMSRRAIVAGMALTPCAALPAIAVAAPPPADADLVALGDTFEKLFLEYTDLGLRWAPRLRAAHAAVREQFGERWLHLPWENRQAAMLLLDRTYAHSGGEAISDRMSVLWEAMSPIADEIKETSATSLGGLRAKALVLAWELRPASADHDGEFEFPDDDGATRSLFYATAALTGLAPMVREIEARLAADATIVDGLNEPPNGVVLDSVAMITAVDGMPTQIEGEVRS